ncbi:PucR family transcriptional regulator [Cryptosporangium phraense]|uniref:PucR family transcriptional regulator n=1 Tax=Cryptosporangium phraense TaxID=2593070 RepID=A0A545AZT8_9ACTN|nr:helix-turn-helix domain-containing protein [Cryptosporangium phraense]TQS46115.1 PucR family transcriptional regulator [Cryptosporangium phraense]
MVATDQAEHVDSSDRSIVTAAARSLLIAVPELTDRLVSEFARREGVILAAEVRRTLSGLCRSGLEAAIATLERPDGDRPDLRVARDIGSLWAARGLPLDSLLRLYRLAGQVLWESLLQAVGPAGAGTLAYQVGGVLRGIDQESTAAASAYRQTEGRLLPRGRAHVASAIDVLLSGRPADAAAVEAAADLLDLPGAGRYVVAVQRPGAPRALAAAYGRTTHGGMRFSWRRGRDTDRVLVLLGDATLDAFETVLRPLAQHAVGIGPCVGRLTEVGKSLRGAELALRTCTDRTTPEIARFDRRLPHALVLAEPDLADDLVREVLGAVLALPTRHREPLLDTLEAWLRCEGSAVATARALYCHRNTVLYRLRRLQELTARSLGRPSDLVDLALALYAVRSAVVGAADAAQPMIERTSGA